MGVEAHENGRYGPFCGTRSVISGSNLVGADGGKSTVRRILFAGRVAINIPVPSTNLDSDQLMPRRPPVHPYPSLVSTSSQIQRSQTCALRPAITPCHGFRPHTPGRVDLGVCTRNARSGNARDVDISALQHLRLLPITGKATGALPGRYSSRHESSRSRPLLRALQECDLTGRRGAPVLCAESTVLLDTRGLDGERRRGKGDTCWRCCASDDTASRPRLASLHKRLR